MRDKLQQVERAQKKAARAMIMDVAVNLTDANARMAQAGLLAGLLTANWREYYNQLVITGQARSEPPDSWYQASQRPRAARSTGTATTDDG
jgi:hypothetical protein